MKTDDKPCFTVNHKPDVVFNSRYSCPEEKILTAVTVEKTQRAAIIINPQENHSLSDMQTILNTLRRFLMKIKPGMDTEESELF